jgi:alpha-beta hydrolase superfamily lysophospholipase
MSRGSACVIIGPAALEGTLTLPEKARGIVLFAHGSGSSRLSPRNQHVARALEDRGFATLLLDLLTPAEALDSGNVFDIELLAERVSDAISWVRADSRTHCLPLGLFGASTGAAAALVAAARHPGTVGAVVSRGGRPDLAAG